MTLDNQNAIPPPKTLLSLKRYFLVLIATWTLLIVGLGLWHLNEEIDNTRDQLNEEARALFFKDKAFRMWAASHGGVYVTSTEHTPPNKYLSHIPDRDIETTSGKKLTLMNPAYMVRQLMEDYEKWYGVKGHITSLKPLRPENTPDEWERAALESFTRGTAEVSEFAEINGVSYLRLMQPLTVEHSCLKCHEHQGYKEGDIRGGVGVSVPAGPLFASMHKHITQSWVGLSLLWLLGLVSLTFGTKHARNRVHERNQAVEKMNSAQGYISDIINSMPSILIGVDIKGTVTHWNHEAERVTKRSETEAVGRSLELSYPRLFDEMSLIRLAISERRQQSDPKRVYLRNGETHYEDVTIYPLVASDTIGAVIRVDDVTEQVRLEEVLMQSEKMLSVGGLAAGMAHEINNPLAGIIQNAEVLSNRLTELSRPANLCAAKKAGIDMESLYNFMEDRGIPRMLQGINESGKRVANIVTNMLDFARVSDSTVSSHDLAELLDKTLELATTGYDIKRHHGFKTIEIKKEYEERLPPIPCDSGKVQQVLLNILSNGAHAMQEELDKRKALGDKPISPCFILRLIRETENDMLRLEIENNGPSIDETIRRRVFEPFFTTKPAGIGTGLGLSVSYFIITENHGGTMRVESEPGKGTNFIIRLPLSGKPK